MKNTLFAVAAIALGAGATFFFKPLALMNNQNATYQDAMLHNTALRSSGQEEELNLQFDMESLAKDMDYIQSYSAKRQRKSN